MWVGLPVTVRVLSAVSSKDPYGHGCGLQRWVAAFCDRLVSHSQAMSHLAWHGLWGMYVTRHCGGLGGVLLHYVPDFLARRREIELPTRHQRRDSPERPLGQRAVAGRENAQPVDVVLV